MNPVLLKPGSDRRSQVVVLGHPEAEADAVGYRSHAPRLRQVALDSLARLRDAYDVVICEGAGSPAEINLRDTDVANMGLARPPACRSSWSGTSTAAGCSPPCSARWPCSRPLTRRSSPVS